MKITASNYILNVFPFPKAPTISVSVNKTPTKDIKEIINVYQKLSDNYINSYLNAANIRDYIFNRLKKDMLNGVGLATINKITNEYQQNIKGKNYFNIVNKDNLYFDNEKIIIDEYNQLLSLKQNLFDDEINENIEYQGNGWSTDKRLPISVYDEQAIYISSNVLNINKSEKICFIKDGANKFNNLRTFTAYQINPDYNKEDIDSQMYIPEFTLYRDKEKDLWVIKNTENIILKTTENIDTDSIVWSEPTSE